MSFVLLSRTRGDELIESVKMVVATSSDRAILEREVAVRREWREGWLADHSDAVPSWAECGLIDKEWIEEIPTL